MRRRRAEATTSPAEFEQQRDVARVLDFARRSTAALQGKAAEELGESAWVDRTDNAGVGFHLLGDPPEDDDEEYDDELDRFYGPNGGFWE